MNREEYLSQFSEIEKHLTLDIDFDPELSLDFEDDMDLDLKPGTQANQQPVIRHAN